MNARNQLLVVLTALMLLSSSGAMVAGAAPAASVQEDDSASDGDIETDNETVSDDDTETVSEGDDNETADNETPDDGLEETPEEGTQSAMVTFEDQTTDGETVVVQNVTMASGGFVTIHDSSLLVGNVIGSVIGTSEYLEPGTHENVTVTLDEPLEEDETLIAMPHRDTNDNQTYDFVETDGQQDGPYLTPDDEPVTDDAVVTVEDGAVDEEPVDEAPDDSEETEVGDFDVSNLEPMDVTVTQGDVIDVSATITNTGEAEATQTVEFRVDGEALASEEVTLAGDENETVTFEGIDTAALEPGDYTHGVYTEDANQTATLTVEAAEEEPVDEEPVEEEPVEEEPVEEEPVDEEPVEEEPVDEEPVEEEPVDEEPAEDERVIEITIEEATVYVFVIGDVEEDDVVEEPDDVDEEDDLDENVTDDEDALDDEDDVDENVTDDEDDLEENVTDDEDELDDNVTDDEDALDDEDDLDENVTDDEDALDDEDDVDDNVTDDEDEVDEEVSDSFTVENLDAPESATAGDEITVSAEISNPTDEEDTQEIQFRLEGDLVDSQNVTLDAGENETVEFDVDTTDIEPGEYVHMVLSDEFGEVAEIELTEAEEDELDDDDGLDDNETDEDDGLDDEDDDFDDNETDDDFDDNESEDDADAALIGYANS
ncbi:hypothetical protein ACFO5R_08315 [Halosolutus amylolyticus]|uniref:DUF7282 domain-containing protein n=1 Tax=Halosolutus amylolyticus TaxID=2932267 RepID=A0ABD5PN37_9EURY|nr:hypothetical protein [Halosolutus amylolyticus]